MSGPADRFEAETDAFSDVRLAGPGEYLHEYTGVLAETGDRVRIHAIAPELAEVDAAVDAFAQVSDRWYNASANANILTIRDRGTEPRPWIAVPNNSIDSLATLQADLSPDAIELIINETADTLRTVSLYNTGHGYLSPDDIYLSDAGDEAADITVEVGGFGLEGAVQAAVGEFEPTPYTAPELLDNPDQPTEHMDVYGLAAVTFFALTDHPPVAGADLTEAIRDGPSSPPSTYDDAIPAELDDAVMQALSTRPEDRYDSPYAFGRAFLSAFDSTALAPDADEPEGDQSAAADDTDGDDKSPSEDTGQQATDEDDEDESGSVTRRATLSVLGIGAIGGAGWYLSSFQSEQTTPGAEQTTPGAEQTTPGAEQTTPGAEQTETEEEEMSSDISGAPMFQYDAANTGTNPDETGPQTPVGEQWSYQTGELVNSSPAVVDGTVYVGSRDDYVYALSADDSTEQWAYQTGGEVESSPAVVDGTVYVGSRDNTVYALSADDGTEQWSYETGDWVRSSPAVVDGTVYVGSWDNTVYALSADDGTEQWSYQTGVSVDSSPAVVDGTVYVGSKDNNVYALSADDGTEQWSYQTGFSVDSSPAVVDGTIYVGSKDNNVYALSADDGTEQWSYQTGYWVSSSPAVVDGTVYVGSRDNSVYALSAEDGTEQWSYQTGDSVLSSPAVVDGTVYIGIYGGMFALSAADGTEQWSYEPGGSMSSSPAVGDGTVYVGSYAGTVYALSEQ